MLDDTVDVVEGPEVEWRELDIPIPLHGERLDRALTVLLPEFSRSFSQQLLSEGCVSSLLPQPRVVNKASARVRMGERYHVVLRPTPQSQAFKPEAMELNVVYQDDDLRIIHKPAGLVVHPAPGNWSGTLLNGLLALDPQAVMLPRAGIVHRLDKDTSGLMVVARSRPAMDGLVQAISVRSMHRQYLALGKGVWQGKDQLSVHAPIGRDPRNRLRMAVVDLDKVPGKTAQTDIFLLAQAPSACLVHCVLHTGRTHQIRVHMASLGHPLLGDTVYAGPAVAGLSRQALHAFRLSFAHPISGMPLAFESSLPPDFSDLLAGWGLRYNVPPL